MCSSVVAFCVLKQQQPLELAFDTLWVPTTSVDSTQVSPKGRGPGRRSEHSAVAVDGTMFVIGGRSTTTEFKDMYTLDTEVDPPVWTEVRMACVYFPGYVALYHGS